MGISVGNLVTIGKLQCYFCGGKTGVFHSVHAYGIYGGMGKRVHYHPECLEMAETYPEYYGHQMVDKALHIHELRERNEKNTNNNITENIRNKVEKLQQYNYERMMPRKK